MGYAVKLQPQVAQIYNGDKVNVALTGSNTGTYVFSVCYVAKDEVCLLSDTSMGTANWSTACAKSWGWSCKIRGKQYSSSDAGQSVAKIPTLEEITDKSCAITREYEYWLSTYPMYFKTQPYYITLTVSWIQGSGRGAVYCMSESTILKLNPFISIIL